MSKKTVASIAALFVFLTTVPFSVLAESDETKAKVVDIFLHQNFSSGRFYMLINHADVNVKNTPPGLLVGYSIGPGGGLYIEKEDTSHFNGMFFVHKYDGGDFPSYTIVEFGGPRLNDIHIRLPEGFTAKIHINNVD